MFWYYSYFECYISNFPLNGVRNWVENVKYNWLTKLQIDISTSSTDIERYILERIKRFRMLYVELMALLFVINFEMSKYLNQLNI